MKPHIRIITRPNFLLEWSEVDEHGIETEYCYEKVFDGSGKGFCYINRNNKNSVITEGDSGWDEIEKIWNACVGIQVNNIKIFEK